MLERVSTSDFELLQSSQNGNDSCEEALLERYSRLVRACAHSYFLYGADNEDLVQEGMLGLLSAIRHYSPVRGASFRAFAEQCVRRRMLDAVKAYQRKKKLPLNEAISYDDYPKTELSDFGLQNPENLVIARENADELLFRLTASLSGYEQRVLSLYLQGFSLIEIASTLNKSQKSVDNALQRIRSKLVKQLKSSDNSEN